MRWVITARHCSGIAELFVFSVTCNTIRNLTVYLEEKLCHGECRTILGRAV
ncbi:MAG: hypothetical protein ACJAVI_003691 [Candidatus Azotimanducaceae bacterium]|jgi:hypothetical protein